MKQGKPWFLFLASFYFLFFLTTCVTNPVTGEAELSLVSESQEIAMGKQYYEPTVQSFDGLYPDPSAQAYVDRLGQKLSEVSHRPGLDYEFKIVNTSMVNAFALPGGKICVTRGLLTHFDKESQLVAVLGHEIGHVTAKHAVRQMSRQMLLGTLFNVGAIALDTQQTPYKDAFLTLGAIGIQAGLARYSRDQETESDELGLNYMTKLNYDPQGAVDVFQVFQKLQEHEPSSIDLLFASHPQSKDREAHAKALIATEYVLASQKKDKIMNSDEFKKLSKKLKQEKPYYEAHDQGLKAASERLWNKAIGHFQTAVKSKPDEALFHTHLGFAYAKIKDFNQSDQHLKKAIQLYPQFFKPRYFLGVSNYDRQHYIDAIRYLTEADQILPGSPQLRLIFGESFEGAGNVRQAVQYYKYVYQVDSKGRFGQIAAHHLVRLGVLKPAGQPPRR